ncbi:hypothetical protein GCM10027343_30920 [Noviherbaspirillum agri]
MKNHILKSFLGTAMLSVPFATPAEDIDLFISQPPTVSTEAPNVLLVIDNAANFSASVNNMRCRISSDGEVSTSTSYLTAADATKLDGTAGAVEQCALYSVIRDMDVSSGVKVNLGVMVYNANGMKSFDALTGAFSSPCDDVNSNGGCLVAPMVPLNATTRANLLNWIKNWEVSGNSSYNIKGNGSANGASMQEAWAYFTGATGISGRNYAAIKPSSTCKKNNVIFIGNAYRNNSSPGDQTTTNGPKSALEGTNATAAMNANPPATQLEKTLFTDTITTSCGTNTLETSENKGVYALNWTRYMKNTASVTTYSVGVLGPTCNGEYAAHLTKMGDVSVGGGKYFATNNFEELKTALKTVLGEIQAVNTVFAAVSLPISVNTQGTYLNQVYIGMFRPDKDALPRWDGNLKQYRLGMINNQLKLLDSVDDQHSTVNAQTGFITECARSYWTSAETDNYWVDSLKSAGGCSPETKFSNSPDGNVVEKGGHAYMLRSIAPATRIVKTCSPVFATCSTTSALTSFDTDNSAITQSLLDPTTGANNRTALINWARGLNVSNELNKGTTVMRPSSHGDVVHSRPVAINYGTDDDPNVVVYYGGNDGMLRAINGNRTASLTSGAATFEAGSELWSFMPPEFYGNIKRLYDNDKVVSFKGSGIATALPKAYGFDGPITAFQGQIDNADKVYVYAAMRRGGRALYAFDATDPANPTLKWKKGCKNNFPASGAVSDAECSTGFSGIGQTWSAAKVLHASGYDNGATPMLIFGGGYDTCEDTDDGTVNHSCTGTTKGNKIYVLDAETGTQLAALSTLRAVAGDVTIVRDNVSGMAKYAYATDMGGNVYRISGVDANTPFESTSPGNWTITRIASLGCDTVAGCNANRKFLYAPDVVFDNGLYVLLIGSGDREKPLSNYTATYGVSNHFFMVKDDPSDATWLSSETANCDGTAVICKNSLFAITDNTTPEQTSLDAKKGWYLALAPHEQIVTNSVTVFGTTTFSTHQPAVAVAGTCGSNLGTSLVYNIAYSNASSKNGTDQRYQDLSGDGLPPSPVAGQVTLDDGQTVPFCIGCAPASPLEGVLKTKPVTTSVSKYKSRVYWYLQQ